MGGALPETVDFFSRYRCKLHFVDLFDELPRLAEPALAQDKPLAQHLRELMRIQAGVQFDLCLFWDLFNFLRLDAVAALLNALEPHLHGDTRAHCFAVHSLKTDQSGMVYGIREVDQINLRPRPAMLPGYSPHNQGQLERVLGRFSVTRSVLLAQSRLELLLSANRQT